MAKLIIHSIKCMKPQERSTWYHSSNGDEMWARLSGDGDPVYFPHSGTSTWQMVRSRTVDVDMEVEFTSSAELEIWDDDSLVTNAGHVQQRDNEILAIQTFLITDEQVERERIMLDRGEDADGAAYQVLYSLR